MDQRVAELVGELDVLRERLDELVLARLLDVEDPDEERVRQRAFARAQRALERAREALVAAGADRG